MANMSYCRFENTERDLRDCLDALNDGVRPGDVSRSEAKAMIALIRLCVEVAEDYGDVVE